MKILAILSAGSVMLGLAGCSGGGGDVALNQAAPPTAPTAQAPPPQSDNLRSRGTSFMPGGAAGGAPVGTTK